EAGSIAKSCDDGWPLRNKFCRKHRQTIYFAVGIADIEEDVTTLDIPKRLHVGPQRLREGSAGFARKDEWNAENRNRRLLCPRRERPRRRRAAEQRDEVAALHSITSSARASSVAGTVTPSASAVLRLITRSNFVGCSTGISAGFAPRRILSVNSAARRKRLGKFVP